jgi:hypothetical protein
MECESRKLGFVTCCSMAEGRELAGQIGREYRMRQTDGPVQCPRQMRVEEREDRDPHTDPSDNKELG